MDQDRCPECGGSGRVRLTIGNNEFSMTGSARCARCRGTGKDAMKLPPLFKRTHSQVVFSIWTRSGRPSIVTVIPREPLGLVEYGPIAEMASATVTVVRVRCWNDRGVLRFEAASEADLRAAEEWAEKHKDTTPEDFAWMPPAT